MASVKTPKGVRIFEPERAGLIRRRLEQRARSKAERRALARRRIEDLEEQRRLAQHLFDVFDGGPGSPLQ